MSLTTVRCASCGSTNTTATRLYAASGTFTVDFEKRDAKRGHESFPIDRVRVCFDCGHVMLALSQARLALLRGAVDRLAPIGEG